MFVIRRVLIANRGEIAVRVIGTCRRLGIETVLAVSEADADSVPARLADRTISLGPGGLADTYLSVEAVAGAAVAAGADAIHPGYGFLAENPRLARACEAAGVIFIGPGAEALEAVGDKVAARACAVAAGLPVLPGGLLGPGGAPGPGGSPTRSYCCGSGCRTRKWTRCSPPRPPRGTITRRRSRSCGCCAS